MSDKEKLPTSGLGIASLVLGIVGLVICAVPVINQIDYFMCALGAIFGVIALLSIKKGKKGGKGLSIAGLVLNIIAIVATTLIIQAYVASLNQLQESLNTDQTAATSSATTQTDSSSTDASAAATTDSSKYAITDETLGGDYFATVSGTLTNNSGAKANSISVTYTLFDAEGNQVGTASAYTSDLEDGKSWKFEATGTVAPDKVTDYKLSSVDAF